MKKTAIFLLLLLISAITAVHAQTNAVPVTLGQSVVALTGPWKFHIGDNPQWADPNFDDSSWETVDLTPKAGSIDPNQGTKEYVPGWTGKGHPGYSGFAWYRIKVRITGADGPLSLLAPANVDDSYQVFTNGRLTGSFGNFDRPVPTVYNTRPLMFALPGSEHHPDQATMLAFRFYMAPRTLLQQQAGGMHNPPFVGMAGAITPAYHVAWEQQYRFSCSLLSAAILSLAFALLILMVYAFDRTETILLWPLGACVLGALLFLLIFSDNTTQLMPALQSSLLSSAFGPVFRGFWMMTWWAYFGLQDRKWIRNAIFIFVLWNIATSWLFQILLLGGSVPHSVFVANSVNGFAASSADLVLLAVIAYFGLRQRQPENWLLFLALFFYGLPDLAPELRLLHIRTSWFPFGIVVPLVLITLFASLFCFFFVLLGRFRTSQRRQQAMIEDVKQAQEVQQVLIPEQLPQVPGLAIESEYRPAREVGGDFFQIIPDSNDNSVLIVVGDVTGKGLQAGMLVALIVGVIRNQADNASDPLDMLHALNNRLCGRGNAHATCLALRIAADGSATLANAGHLPPYLNGKELSMEGALPLGMSTKADFSVMRFQLQPNDRLMLLSDGVAEARNPRGELFGFDRIRSMLEKPIAAGKIAAIAQTFGQQDDISVLSVTLSPALKEAIA